MSFTTSKSDSDLPPPRRGKAIASHKTHLPGSKISLAKFIYLLCALIVAFTAFNVWRVLQYKTAVGGWWNLALGKGVSTTETESPSITRESVEDGIISLAKALGIPSRDLASAIAEAVRHNVPPASLSSASAAEATTGGAAVSILVGDKEDNTGAGAGIAEKLNVLSSFDDTLLD